MGGEIKGETQEENEDGSVGTALFSVTVKHKEANSSLV